MNEDERKLQERKEQEREDFRRTGGMVTRIEFYAAFLLLVALVLLRGGLTNQNLGLVVTAAQGIIMNEIDSGWNDLSRDMAEIPEQIMVDRESPFWEQRIEIASVDQEANTLRLLLQATPKEYREGMEGLFYVTCDDGETAALPAAFDGNRVLRAETELPICGRVSVTAALKENGTEKIRVFDDLDVEEEIVPRFSSLRQGASENFKKSSADFQINDTTVYVSCPDKRRGFFSAGKGELEIQVDGKAVVTAPMEQEMQEKGEWRYWLEGESDAADVKFGQHLSVVFKMQDGDGATYSCLLRDGIMTEEGLEEKPVSGEGKFGG